MGVDINLIPPQCLPEDERKARGKAGWTKEESEKAYESGQEKELQDDIASWFDLIGIYYSRSRMDRRTTVRPGTPDFLASVDGIFLGIECKTGKSQPSPEQILEHKAIHASKGRVVVAYDLKTVQKAVRNIQAEMRFVRETLYKTGWKMK